MRRESQTDTTTLVARACCGTSVAQSPRDDRRNTVERKDCIHIQDSGRTSSLDSGGAGPGGAGTGWAACCESATTAKLPTRARVTTATSRPALHSVVSLHASAGDKNLGCRIERSPSKPEGNKRGEFASGAVERLGAPVFAIETNG